MKWGILATGTIAKKFAATVNQMKDAKEVLVAVGSRREESARQFAEEYQIQKYYGSYEELAEDPEVEVVYVATPNNFHYENCEMCLNAGKHVLCEKPFTTNADEARELYRLAEEKLEADERRYQLGLLSANDRMAAQAELSSKKAAWEISGLSFRQAYEDYQWAVEGLAAYEG